MTAPQIPRESTNKPTPRVSVCVVTYNQRAYIAECLQSIINQETKTSFEILIADDASSDGTTDIVKYYASLHPGLIKAIINKNNVGPYVNYRMIHREAQGELIAHMDGDDKWSANKLEEQVSFLDSNAHCPAVYTNAAVINEEGMEIGIFNNPQPNFIDLCYLTKNGNFLLHSSLMYRSLYRFSLDSLPDQFIDYQIHIKFAKIGQLGYLNSKHAFYRFNVAGSLSNQNGGDRIRPLYWSALTEITDGDASKCCKVNALSNFLAKTCIFYLLTGNRKNIKKWANIVRSECSPGQFIAVLVKSAAIIVYMALRKTVIFHRNGGTRRIFFQR